MKTKLDIASRTRFYSRPAGWCATAVLVAAAIPAMTLSANAATPGIAVGGVAAAPGSTLMLPVSFQAGDTGGVSVLLLRLNVPASQVEVLDVIPGASVTSSGKSLDFETAGDRLSLCVFGGRSDIVSGRLCLLLLRLLPGAGAPGFITLSTVETQGADRDALPVAVSGGNGVIGVLAGTAPHKADRDGDWRISFAELLRIIQLYNVGTYHCDGSSEDGFSPGPGDTTCAPHDADYNPPDWQISLVELLRMIQFYNAAYGVYHALQGTGDGFAPGPFGIESG